jgi:hypothetical protein
VLVEDPELAEAIPPAERAGAIEHCLAPVRVGTAWLLRGDPPGELLQLQPVHVAGDDE